MKYPLAPDPVFWTIQGEGHLRGFQMVFIRLGGCSVGCRGCDTDYNVTTRATAGEIVEMARAASKMTRDSWAWITGGDPADHDLKPLLHELKTEGFSTAVATSGVRRVIAPVDWLSVSPHSKFSNNFHQRYGSEIKLVDGLNGLNLDEWLKTWPDSTTDFMYRYVQPMWIGDAKTGYEDPASLARCLDFLHRNPSWSLSRQDHKFWGVL